MKLVLFLPRILSPVLGGCGGEILAYSSLWHTFVQADERIVSVTMPDELAASAAAQRTDKLIEKRYQRHYGS